MPQTRKQIDRQRAEGSLRRQFDYLITRMDDATLARVAERWEEVVAFLKVPRHGSFCMRHGHAHPDTGNPACQWQEGT